MVKYACRCLSAASLHFASVSLLPSCISCACFRICVIKNEFCVHTCSSTVSVSSWIKKYENGILWEEICILLPIWLRGIVHSVIFFFCRDSQNHLNRCMQVERKLFADTAGSAMNALLQVNIWQTFLRNYSIKCRPSQSYQNLPDAAIFVCLL